MKNEKLMCAVGTVIYVGFADTATNFCHQISEKRASGSLLSFFGGVEIKPLTREAWILLYADDFNSAQKKTSV